MSGSRDLPGYEETRISGGVLASNLEYLHFQNQSLNVFFETQSWSHLRQFVVMFDNHAYFHNVV